MSGIITLFSIILIITVWTIVEIIKEHKEIKIHK